MPQMVHGECANGGGGGGASHPQTQAFPTLPRQRVPPLSSAVESPSSDDTMPAFLLLSVYGNKIFLILYCASVLIVVRWHNNIEFVTTATYPTDPMVHILILVTWVVQFLISKVQDHLFGGEHGNFLVLVPWLLFFQMTNDIVSVGLYGWAPRNGLMNDNIVTSSLQIFLCSTLVLRTSDLVFLITKVKNLASAVLLILASGYRYLNRKLVNMVSLLGLLLLALVFGGIYLTTDNRLAMTHGSEIKMVNNYKHSHDRMLHSISHETEGNVGKDNDTIKADLILTAGNADGSEQDQKALPHWTSNQNSNQSGNDYEEQRWMQEQNGPGKPHLSAHKIIKTVVVSSIAVAVASALVAVCYILVLLCRKCGNRAQINAPLAQRELCRLTGSEAFQYNELVAVTNNFAQENKIGQGGFGPVYRGFLRNPDRHVAIKLLSSESSWQGQKEFEAEVSVLTQLRHRNIVHLVGWCDSNEGLLLVYELMAEGSLDKHLHNPVQILSWQQRHKIILDLGSALFYLHRCCDKCIVHGDIKPQNVMLDASYNAKLGDFGTARLIDHGADPRTTEIVAGTGGYIDPEFVNNHLRCPEADIYSFGVALLEIASGKRPASRLANEASALPVWVRSLYDRRMILDAADGKMNGNFDRQQMERVLVTGLWCAHQDPSQRPSINQAMDVLRSADATLPVLPTRDPQQVRFLEELAYGDLTGEGGSVDVVVASTTCYLTSKDSASLIADE